MSSAAETPGEREHDRMPRSLPPGYEAHAVWTFGDRTGRFSYEFNRVYGPAQHGESRGPVCVLDEALSYWRATWTELDASGEERQVVRSLTYAAARKLRGAQLSFERFSSVLEMRDQLPELLLGGGPGEGLESVSGAASSG